MSNKEYPEEGEFILCSVKEILKTVVFVTLDEYNKTGTITTAEIAPGRIRNIRDYVIPNKKIVCKVLKVDKAKGHISLSFRRVSLKERMDLMDKFKKERNALAVLNKIISDKERGKSIIEKVKEKYSSLSGFFELATANNELFRGFDLKEEEIEKIVKATSEKTKPKKVIVKASIKIEDVNSIENIKEALKVNNEKAKVTYISAPCYLISLKGNDYKEANKKLSEIIQEIGRKIKKAGGKFSSEAK